MDNVTSFNQLLEALHHKPDAIVLLCTRLSGFSLQNSLSLLQQHFPLATFILMSEHFNSLIANQVNQGCANAYLLTISAVDDDYLKAIDACLHQKKYYPSDVAQLILLHSNQPLKLHDAKIRTVLELMLQSKTVKEMGAITGIPESTVRKKHDKIKAVTSKHKYGLLGYALQHRLITQEMVG